MEIKNMPGPGVWYPPEGLEQGKKEEAARISTLINRLLADGREQDILLLGDQETLERLLKEYSL